MAESQHADGRHERGRRNREAVVDAMLELLREGVEQPGAAQVAERAGVSIRSVFRHFDNLEALNALAVERQAARLAPLIGEPPREGSVAARIRSLIAQRALLYEEMLPVRRAGARFRASSPAIQRGIRASNRRLRRQLLDALGDDTPASADVVTALEAVTSLGLWTQLRIDQGRSVAETAAAMTAAAVALVS
jgi:AcrR family transcriptional regulator